MCVIQRWTKVHPNGVPEELQRIEICRRGTPNRACQWTTHERLPDQIMERISLQEIQPRPGMVARPTPVVVPAVPLARANTDSRNSRRKDSGLRLKFSWHIPFTSKKAKSGVTIISPLLRPRAQEILSNPSPTREYYPAPRQFGPPRYPDPPLRPLFPDRPASAHQNLPQVITSPQVITVEPNTPDSIRSGSRRGSQRGSRQSSQRPVARVHTRRPNDCPPSPIRRNYSRGRVTRINNRLDELEEELRIARTSARLQTIARLESQIRDEHIRRDQEAEADARWLEAERSAERFQRERSERLARDRQRSVEIHQPRGENLANMADRGARTIARAVRMAREEERVARGGGRERDVARREQPSEPRRRRSVHGGERIVDDRRRTWGRWP